MSILYESLYELNVGPVLTGQFLSRQVGEGGWRESASFSREGRYIKIVMTYPHQNHIQHEFEAYIEGIGWTRPVAIHSKCGEFTGSPPTYLDVRTAIKAIDGNLGSWWQCNSIHAGWIVFDLGSTKTVTRVRVYQGQYMDIVDIYVGDNPAEFIPSEPLKPLPMMIPIALAGVVIIGGVIYLKRRK